MSDRHPRRHARPPDRPGTRAVAARPRQPDQPLVLRGPPRCEWRNETERGAAVRARLGVRAALDPNGDPTLRRAPIAWRELDARLWEMDWREHFQPVVAGRSLVVVPPWNRERFGTRRRIVIHPGMAFGTGQHA